MKIIDLLCQNRQFHQSLEKSRPRLQRMARSWCGDATLADDLSQEALARALQHQGQLRSIEKFDAWIFTILSNCWREHLRRKRPNVEFHEEEHFSDFHTPESSCNERDVVARVRHEVSRLPDLQRQTLTLVDLEEFSYAEAAQILDVPIGTIMSRIHRARSKLRSALGDLQQELPTPREAPAYLRCVK